MAKYFSNVNDLQELRKQYKNLLKKHHPDNGGNVADMQEINAEYDILFKVLKDRHDSKTTGSRTDQNNADTAGSDTKSTYNENMYDWENDKALREALEKIIAFSGIEILICGQWIWVSGNTYNYKKELKEIGFKWASQKKQWYWKSEAYQKKSRKTLSMDEIRNYYGSIKIRTEDLRVIEA